MFKNLFVATIKVRYSLITCKRKNYNGPRPKKVLPYKSFMKFNYYRRLLKDKLGIESGHAVKILLKEPKILNLPKEHLASQCKLLLKWNYDSKSLLEDPEPFFQTEKTLENVTMLLKDMGAQFHYGPSLKSFRIALTLPMSMWKAYMQIPEDNIVAENFLKCIKQPAEGVEPLTIPKDSLSVDDYLKRCLRWYVKWRLNVSEENEGEMRNALSSLKHRSFTIMEQVFEICHNEIGLSVEEIIKHGCLKHGSPSNLRLIIDEQTKFYGSEMKKLLKTYPILCRMNYANAIKVINLLEKHNVTEMAIQRYPQILLTNPYNLESKLQTIDASLETRYLKNNVKSLDMMLYSYSKSQVRLSYLRYLNIKFTTVRLLCMSDKAFGNYLVRGEDRSRAREIGFSFTKLLNIEPDVIIAKLRKHPYWNRIDLVSLHDTSNFLIEQGFELEDIIGNMPILLYPRQKIAKALQNLGWCEKKQGSSPRPTAETGAQTLALCLYEIERDFHFSHDGVWRDASLIPKPSSEGAYTSGDNND